jgi:hypothetical protein
MAVEIKTTPKSVCALIFVGFLLCQHAVRICRYPSIGKILNIASDCLLGRLKLMPLIQKWGI